MNVLVLNVGSASLKFEVITAAENPSLDQLQKQVKGSIEGIGSEAVLSQLKGQEVIQQQKITAKDYAQATQEALKWLGDRKQSESTAKFDIIAHRVVHGADSFTGATLIDEQVIADIEALEELAPLHNAPAVSTIRATRDVLGSDIPMVAVFDTVFHQNIPEHAKLYAIPKELSERHRIRRYGFHGISHQYMMMRYAQMTARSSEEINIITMHLESGCSATAIKAGKSIDTSMGFTPLEGLVMGFRSGDIDPAIIGYLARIEGIEVAEVEKLLNKKSGLLGLSGVSHDTRELMKQFGESAQVRLAMEIFCYRIRKYVGAYLAALGGAEAIIFGGGIGEDTPFVRERICVGFKWCGLTLDSERNQQVINSSGRISSDDSSLHAYVIPVEEGLMIAQEAINCINSQKDQK